MGFNQPLTEMSTGLITKKNNVSGSKVRPVRGVDNLTAIYEPDCIDNVGFLTAHNPKGLHGLLRG
jgi:hypothetical protein